MHIELLIDYRNGKALKEPVHAKSLGNKEFILESTPGLVLGVASGDKIELLNENGEFKVLERGMNLAVQLYSIEIIRPLINELSQLLQPLNGIIDGAIDKGIACTIPVDSGFKNIEEVFDSFVTKYPHVEWYYGNVYDPKDGITPLNWWN